MHAEDEGVATIEVAEEDSGERLDVVLVRRLADASRSRIRRLIEAGGVRVDGRRARKGDRVREGQRIEVASLPEPGDFDPIPAPDAALSILYEDARLVAVDKPAGMPTHPLRPHETGTAANALVARYPEMAGVGYARREPGIVHRLDTNTSGVLLAARDAETFSALRDALARGRVDKRYVALCGGEVEAPLAIDVPLATDPRNARRVVAATDGRRGRTEVLSSERIGEWSLVEIRAPRAGRHQVRAHLAHVGHPLAGDPLYAGGPIAGLPRHFLHASSVELDRPDGSGRVRIESPFPADLAAVVDRLRAGA